jgi:hypothetical protein
MWEESNNMRIDILEKNGLNIDGKEILPGSPIQEAIAKLGVSDVFEDHYYFLMVRCYLPLIMRKPFEK